MSDSRIGDVLDIVVPPCGHPYCDGFMGCTEEANVRMGYPVIHPSPWYPPASTVQVRVVHTTGFRHRDWEFV